MAQRGDGASDRAQRGQACAANLTRATSCTYCIQHCHRNPGKKLLSLFLSSLLLWLSLSFFVVSGLLYCTLFLLLLRLLFLLVLWFLLLWLSSS